MKRMRRIAVLAMTVALILGTMAVSVFAADEYEHKLTVSPGNGSGSTMTGDSITIEQNSDFTGTLTVDGKSSTVAPPDDNHFVTGIKVAGRDNASTTVPVSPISVKDEDVEYVVTYGLKSNMVSYTVTYTGPDGELGSDTFYGVIGDKPVVTYKYFEGYEPANAYSLTKTLKADTSENVFEFTYNEAATGGTNVVTVNTGGGAGNAGGGGAGGGAGGGGAAGGGAGGAGGAAGGANIADAATPTAEPAELIDIDNPETPTTENPGDAENIETIDDSKTPGTNWSTVGIGAGAAAVVAIAAALIAKRRKDEEEE